MADQDVEQIRPEPSSPVGCDRHGEVTVAVVAHRVAGLARDLLGDAITVDDRDHTETTLRGDVGPLSAPFDVRPEGSEEPPVTVAHRQRLVQGQDALGVGRRGLTHLHARAAGQLDDLGEVGVVHPAFSLPSPRPPENFATPRGIMDP